jgi:type I restriction enzyme S subunit
LKKVQLGTVAKVLNGYAFKSKEYVDDGIRIVRITNVQKGRIQDDDPRFIDIHRTDEFARFMLDDGDILLSLTGNVGRVGVIEKSMLPAALNQRVGALKIDSENVEPKYLFHVLNSENFEQDAIKNSKGIAQLNLSSKWVEKYEIPLPPLAEQKQIAVILDAADALRAKRRESLAQLDTLLQSTFLDMFGDPVTNPMEWERRTLGEIINFVGGSQPPKDTFTYEPSEDTVRLVQIRDFKSDRYRTYIPKVLARRQFNEDDVMIARYGPPVFQILTGLSGSYNVALMKAEPIGPVEKPFIFHLLNHPAVNGAVVAQSERTAGQSGVNLRFLNKYPAYLPPLDLQNRFAAIVGSVEQQKARQRAHLAELNTLFASLQSRAFRGGL